jgi:S-DNA-T family DNA segregation ATPase FtsK/SpoIIIE
MDGFGGSMDYRPTLRERFELLRDRGRVAMRVLIWALLVLDVCLAASVLTNWMGAFGRAARGVMVGRFGGGIMIVLFYALYLCASAAARKKVPQPLRQTLGVLSLYVCDSLVLGLLNLVSRTSPASSGITLLSPGAFGENMARWCFENIGPLGATLFGVCGIAFSLACFGFTRPFLWAYYALQDIIFRLLPAKKEPSDAEDEVDEDDDEAIPNEDEDNVEGVEGVEDSEDEKDYEDAKFAADDDFQLDEEDIIDCGAPTNLPTPVDVIAVDEMAPGDGNAPMPTGQFPPPFDVYGREAEDADGITREMARPWGERIIDSLAQFGVEAELADILLGPTVIQFRIQPLPGVKVNKIVSLANDLTMALAVSSLRVEAPIPGHPYVGIEIPNPRRRGITLRSIIEEDEYQFTDRSLPLPMGVTINGDPLVIGLEDLPHLLVAGTTGSGKSVFVNSCIIGLCSMRRPDELKMVLIDPKRVEMAAYEKLPHILTPPVTDPKKAVHVLAWAIREMERRYSCFAESRVRNLASYNEIVIPKDRLPHIVIVVDEFADLMMTAAKEVEEYVCRLAQMARATGIHLMLATQRPSVNVITGLIKANVPARVAFTLPSMMDSRTIIDCGGAEKLLGKGDMLFLSTQNPKPVRVQCPWIDEHSVTRWMDYLVNMFGEPIYTDIDDQSDAPSGFEEMGGFDDALLDEAVKIVVTSGMASASGLQRRLRVGFTRAGRLVDMMETAGIIGPADGARPREILVDEDEAEAILERLRGPA